MKYNHILLEDGDKLEEAMSWCYTNNIEVIATNKTNVGVYFVLPDLIAAKTFKTRWGYMDDHFALVYNEHYSKPKPKKKTVRSLLSDLYRFVTCGKHTL